VSKTGGIAPRKLSLRELDDILSSDAHYDSTHTRNYGPNDPVLDAEKFICPCSCGSHKGALAFDLPNAGQLVRRGASPRNPERRHFVTCPDCGRRGLPTGHDWAAVIEWNRERYDASFPIDRFPFFLLSGMELKEARGKVLSIRSDLELRVAQAKSRIKEGIHAGNRYRERLEAYLGWAIAASSLLKMHARARQEEFERRRTGPGSTGE